MAKAKPKKATKAKKSSLPDVPVEPIAYEGLSQVQNLFVFWRARTGSNAEAARRAGYSKTRAKETGYQLMHSPGVAAAVKAETRRHLDELGIDDSWVIVGLANKVEQYSESKPAQSLRALELIARIRGMFEDRLSVSGPNGGPIEVSDAKSRLAERLARLAGSPDPGGDGEPDG
jgi:hypothetical protein